MESKKSEYFIDGFMIRHFGIFPTNFDKENLLEEQKIFLVYLLAVIPDLDEWKLNVEYKTKLDEIKKIKSIDLDQTEKDLAEISGTNIFQLHKEKLFKHKKVKIQELNKKFGIIEAEEEVEKTVEIKPDIDENNPAKLWDMLQGKGLVK